MHAALTLLASIVSLAALFATPTAAQTPPGPIAAWSFNEGTGSTLADSVGSRDGAILGATWAAGRYGQALDFAGSAAVDLGDLDLLGAFSVSAWMQTRSLATGTCRSLVMKARDYGFEICDGRLYAGVGNGTSFTAYLSTPLTPADLGVWKHVALAYDGATLRFYVDGVLVASGAGAHVASVNPLYFGRWVTGEYWDGRIDEVRIYDRALGIGEIQADLATPVPDPSTTSARFRNEIVIASGLNLPTNVAFLPDGSMLVGELGGTIKVIPPGATQPLPTPFLALTNVGSTNGQQGLMDIELDPGFASNGHYYVFYTLGSPNRDRVSRFTANGLTTNLATELVVYQDPQSANAEHHGGALAFLPDGKLYISTGEHFDPPAAQDLASPRGKILRINPDGTIPTDNPFYDGAGPNRDEVWALGLRNPYRMAYDAPSDRLFIGDVGGNEFTTAIEEINVGSAGANFGWPACEGSCPGTGFKPPLYAYSHLGRDAAVTGGFVYRGTQFPPEYVGSYFFADYAQNWIRRLTFDANGNLLQALHFEPPDGTPDGPYGDIVHLAEGPDGALYYVDLGYSDTTGTFGVAKIRRIRYEPADDLPPIVLANATPTSGDPPLAVDFSDAGSSDPEGQPLDFLWSFGDGATAGTASASHVYEQRGRYDATLTVSDGVLSTTSEPIAITVGHAPEPTIGFPAPNSTFRAGEEIVFGGTATDAEDGVLPASAYTWTVHFLHADHVHPALPLTGVTQGSFVVPTSGHDFAGDTRYEIRLTVVDSDGIETTSAILIYPEKVDLSFETVPPGLAVEIDGIPYTTPAVVDSLVDFVHTVDARDQTIGSTTYTFAGWSDGGARTHDITTSAAPTAFTASFTTSVVEQPLGFARSQGVSADASGSSLSVSLSGVQAGSLLVAYVKWEGAAGASVAFGDGTSTFTADAQADAANGDLHGRFFYLPASVASGDVTYTATWSAARPYRRILIYEYVHGSGAVVFDGSNRATATSGSLSSGSVTTSGTDEVLFGAYGEYSAATTANEQIGGLAADQVVRSGFASMWSRRFTAPTTAAATATGHSSTWIGSVIAFKQVGSPNTPPTLSDVLDRTIEEDASTGPIPFTVGDQEQAPGALSLSATSSNPALVAANGIVFGGSGANRTISVTPLANASGTTSITLGVSDGTATTSDVFLLTVTPVNDPPTISTIANQATSSGFPTVPLPITIGDVETSPASLSLFGSSSAPALVPDGNIVFGGSGANRTVTVTPTTGQSGTALITIVVSDGSASAATSFTLTVTASNAPPTISDVIDWITLEDTSTGPIAFTIGDAETPLASLTLSATSSNTAVVAPSGIGLAGSGSDRTVSITPVANASGDATITLTVHDGLLSASDTFVVTVVAVNDLPTISTVAGQTTSEGVAVGPLAITIGDVETAAGSLVLAGASSNPTLVPDANIVFGGSGANRTVTVTPAPGQTGTTTIALSVGDGSATASSSFPLTVVGGGGGAPLAFAHSGGVAADASGTTLSVSLAGVQAGSLLVAYVKWEGAAGASVAFGDGASPFTPDTQVDAANGDLHGRFFYLPASVASGSVTYTATWSAARPYRRILIFEYAQSGGSLVFDGSNRATATSGSLSSGSVATTGTDEVLFGAYGEYSAVTTANEQLGGLAAEQVVRSGFTSMWSRRLTAPTTAAATATGHSATWIGSVIAFKRTGGAPNTPPTLSDVPDRTIAEDGSTGPIPVTVGDAETTPGNLVLSATSSNAAVVAPAGIVIGGSGADRTIGITPVANASGSTTITLSVSDGLASSSDAFVLTVTPVNDAPTLSSVADQTTGVGVAVGPLPVTVGDVETAAGSLVLSATSSNPTLVPNASLAVGGSGANRTLTITPAAGQTGLATITLSVSDGLATATSSFVLTVGSTPSTPLAFARNGSAIGNGGGTSLGVTLANVRADSLIVAYVKWEGASGANVTLSDGTSAFTADGQVDAANGDLHGRFFYLPASARSGSVTYTASWSGSRTFRRLFVYEYAYTGGSVALDASSRATGTSGSLNSGNVTTTGSDVVAFGAYGEYSSANTSNERIAGVVADQVVRQGFASMWSKTFAAPFTGAATATGNSSTWIGSVIAFKRTP